MQDRITASRKRITRRCHEMLAADIPFLIEQRAITVDGKRVLQTLFTDETVFVDISGNAPRDLLPDEALPDGDEPMRHTFNYMRPTSLSHAWDTWSAARETQSGERLRPLNAFTYVGKHLCQVFSVAASRDGNAARRVLINKALLELIVSDIDVLDDLECDLIIYSDGRVCVCYDTRILGYVMPMAEGYHRARGHYGQLEACPTCGGDGAWHDPEYLLTLTDGKLTSE